jgi:transposase InsO family protein
MEHVALGMKTKKALQIVKLSTHQYYYRNKPGKVGRPSSKHTRQKVSDDIQEVSNEVVISKMEHNHADPDLSYGYRRMSSYLQLLGFFINHKKVYRLMKQNNMLRDKAKKAARNFVKYRIINPEGPLQCLEMDIKYVWLESRRTHGYILTVIDTFTRYVLAWHAGMSITQHTVKDVFSEVIVNHLQEHDALNKGVAIEIRNDNDKRFVAGMVQKFFNDNYLNQVFTHPYTPQENGHIESFHAILSRSLDRFVFNDLKDLEMHLSLFYEKYNHSRLHNSIVGLSPKLFWDQWMLGNICRTVISKKKVKFALTIPKQNLLGNGNLREASCLDMESLEAITDQENEVVGAEQLQQPLVHRSPSIASC